MEPTFVSAGLVSYSITAGGETMTAINDTYRVLSVTIEKGVNAISTAQLELIDGDPATAEFPVTDSDTFAPGNPVSISLGYDNTNTLIFSGVVTGYSISSQGAQGIKLTVSCKDEGIAMALIRQTRMFPVQSVTATISSIVGEYSTVDEEAPTDTQDQEQAVQQNVSDWDYIVTRAEANGMLVLSDKGELSFIEPSTSGSASLALAYGVNLYSFSLQVDTRTQVGGISAQSWSLDTGECVSVTANAPSVTLPGNLSLGTLAGALDQGDYQFFAPAEVEQGPLQKLVDALLLRRTLALVQGTVEIPGTDVTPGDLVSLDRVGQRFGGTYFVSKVSHSFGGGDWKTTLTLGLEEKTFAESKPDVSAPAESAKVLAGGDGLHKAVVKAIQPDPDSKYRVQVTVADMDNAVLWARLAQPYATASAGIYFFPEVGDQVIIGFLGGTSSSPVVLGSLYTKNRTPAYTPDDKNAKKAIVTNSKLTLEFDDDQKIITLKTPAGNKLVISDADGGKGFALTDQQNNTVTMSDQGVSVVSKSTLSLSADQDITIKSTGGNVTLQAAQGVTVKGLNVSATADASLTLKGTASAELSASGNTTVKGVMVMIN